MFGRIRILTVLVLLVSLVSMGAVNAASNDSGVYVAVNGSDEDGNGTVDNPYQSLKSAVNVASNGSTIYIFKGTYSGLKNSKLTIDKTLIISSWDGLVTLDGENSYNFFDVTTRGNLTLNGLKLINGNDTDDFNNGIFTAGAVRNYGQLTIINSSFNNNNGFFAGAVLNYGNLSVLNSAFKSNNAINYVGGISSFNYAGGITNFGTANIQNGQFTDNIGGAVLNTGNTTVNSSNFISNAVRCDNFDDTKNSLTVLNSSFENAALAITNSTFYMYNSSLSSSSVNFYSSNATIIGSSFGSYLFLYYNSTLNISYSVLRGIYAYDNSTAQASYNWWGSNKKPDFYSPNILVDYWIIMTFTSNQSPIPSKTDVVVTAALNKYTDGTNVYSLGGDMYLPSRYVSFETDNGLFSSSGGYLVNKSYSTNYLNNTEDTWIYAAIDNQKLRLVVGTGWTDYSIYVSNDGDDYYGDGSKNNPYKTLQKAVSVALNGNKIYLFAGNYTGYYNTGLYINKYLTFNSFNGGVSLYRHSNLNLFNITEFGQLNLNNLNIYSEMSYNALLINNNGVLVLDDCTVANSTGCIGGDGLTKVYNSKFYKIIGPTIYSTNILIVNSSFTNITPTPASNYNDEIIRSYGDLTVINSTFSNSSSTIYGKKFIGSSGNLTVTNSTFINNKLTTLISGGSLISGSKFINNIGAVFAATVENCTFVNNTGLYVQASTINNSLFMDNTRDGSIVKTGGDISNSTFINNSNTITVANYEDYTGYGIVFTGGNSTVTQCMFLNNSAPYGGAIYNAGDLVVSYSVFVNNTAKYLGDEVYNRMGIAYLLKNWWGSNSGPAGEKVYRFLGDVYVYNWVIMTLTANGDVLKASLNKVTDSNGIIQDLGGILPPREVFFGGEVDISPKKTDLVNNQASATIMSGSDKDFRVNATIDNQTVDLMVRNTSTIIDVSNAAFYGKGNVYRMVLRNVNGYLMSNQTLKVTITDQSGKSQVYTLITDGNGMATLTIDDPVGVYRVSVVYGGDGYFQGSNANATIQVLTAITKIISYNETFYGKENTYYATLYDVNGKGVPGQKLVFIIFNGKQSKTYTSVTDNSGRAGLSTADFAQGKYTVKVSYAGNSWYGSSSSTSSFTVYPTKSVLKLLTSVLYGRGNPFVIELRDGKGNVIRNEAVAFTISQADVNQTFNLKTDENGITGLMINLYPGLYNVTAKYAGGSLYGPSSVNGTLTISKVNTKLRTDSVISNFNGVYDVILTDIYDRALVGESVSVTVIDKNVSVNSQKFKTTYTAKTDSKGIAHFLITLDIGDYLVVSNFYANSWYGSTTTASTLIVSNFNVTSIDPVNGTTKVTPNKTIKVTFSENIKKGSNFWVEFLNSSKKAVSFTSSISGKVLTIKPESYLVESLYTLIIHTGAVTNMVGSPISFTTCKFSVGTAPTVSKVDPKNGATKIASSKTIKVTFNENIKKGNNWFELKNSSGKAVPFNYSISGKVLTITPTSNLAESLYTLCIHTGAVTDLAGNPVAVKSTKFSVGTAPTVSKVDPKNGATKVARSKVIKVTFNENIKEGSNYWIELIDSKGKSVKITKSISGKVLTINHAKLVANTKYKLVIHTGAVTDKAGNPVAVKTYTFTTGKT
ncbi:MAG: Copper resistance protein CopC [Methanobacterium sp. PtaU1.Bin097]|jgi:methionine-rich copper-binding protein CopC|nr:MAG: Copper resistance protein CopC [Methanobacterium sp. PtaU1.Bin097]